ncbi:MAG: spermidine synthase [Victivallales bacterium]|nr:spermidine synthase [Victivallales bacterium]
MSQLDAQWFAEVSDMWPGRALAINCRKKLVDCQTPYQHIELYETTDCGKMLVLDDVIQFTEDDEFAYQEMLAHLPLFSHPDPRNILVIGGGDGGVLREVARHDSVEHIDLCEIDAKVVEVCRQYVPSMACGFDDPRVAVTIGDGFQFIRDHRNCYDVIIVDSSDPIGPGEKLFGDEFYALMKEAIKPDGIIATQGESFFMHWQVVRDLMQVVRRHYRYSTYCYMMVPTYPGGTLGVCLGSQQRDVTVPCRRPSPELQAQLRYYTPEIHRAAQILPAFGERVVYEGGGGYNRNASGN